MEKLIIIICGVAVAATVTLFTSLVVLYAVDFHITCTTTACVKAASEVLQFIDESVDPCEDFYQFACGSFLNLTADDNKSHTIPMNIEHTISHQIRQMFEEPIRADDSLSFSLAKKFYRSCMNETAVEMEGLRKMKGILGDIGGWPILEGNNWRESEFDWKRTAQKLRRAGCYFEFFIVINTDVSKINPSEHMLHIGVPKYSEINDIHKNLQLDLMLEIASAFGAEGYAVEAQMKEVQDFYSKLKQVTNFKHTQSDSNSFNPKWIYELQALYPDVIWHGYINELIRPAANVDHKDLVNVESPKQLKNMLDLLKATPNRILANFICWYTVEKFANYLPKQIRERKYNYMRMINEFSFRRQARSEICMNVAEQSMPRVISLAYVHKYITPAMTKQVKQMISGVKREYGDILTELDWLDGEAKEISKEKLANCSDTIADTGERLNEGAAQIYAEAEIREDAPLTSLLSLNVINTDLRYKRLNQTVHDEEAVAKIYSIVKNKITLPASLLQGVYFHEFRPQYMNYGALGSVVAYHLSHMFFEGRNYDLYGNLREWSISESIVNYNEKLKCIFNKYSKFYIPQIGKNVNPTLTQADDLARLLAAKIIYKTYITWTTSNGRELSLPGLSYTPRQIFWISSAIPECSRLTVEDVYSLVLGNRESLPKFRVLGSLQNLQEFSKDFGCRPGSAMNPSEKCELF